MLSLLTARGPASCLPGATRLLVTAAAAAALTLEEQLRCAPWLQLLSVPDQGRGLFAATDLEQGMLIHEEAPMLAAPSPHALDTTCHQCLRPLPLGAIAAAAAEGSAASTAASIPVCSPGCSTAAQDTWASAATADLRPLQQACRESGSKFPLMVAQLALRRIQRELQAGSAAPDARSTAQPKTLFGGEADVACGDPLTQLRHLCYANVSEPPQAWAELHALLLQGLLHSGGNQGSGGVTCSADWMERELSLRWFCDAMARLHINSFRVDTVVPLDRSDPAALLRAAAASLAGAASKAHATGSAAYLLASMLNHSCEPNLDVSFPHNNAVVAFTAARDIAQGEQLTISYVDTGLGLAARRQALEFGYGFACGCPRCVEEEGAHAKT